MDMTLYQADLSPYAARVRIQLRAKGIEDKVDFVSILYVIGGVPVSPIFLFVLFWFARSCNTPA